MDASVDTPDPAESARADLESIGVGKRAAVVLRSLRGNRAAADAAVAFLVLHDEAPAEHLGRPMDNESVTAVFRRHFPDGVTPEVRRLVHRAVLYTSFKRVCDDDPSLTRRTREQAKEAMRAKADFFRGIRVRV